jgi:hypothetical protein
MTYDEAVARLYQTPLGDFVEERKRLARELKTGGDKEGSARFAKLSRPPISAWAVNQLYWTEHDLFESMLTSAERLREGDLAAGARHRDAIARLRDRAAAILGAAGHGANEATLRRISTTLSAIAALGFDPDPAGALSADRDPPGFEAMTFVAPPAKPAAPAKPLASIAKPDAAADARAAEARAAERKAREAAIARREAEEKAREQERARREAEALRHRERVRVEAALRVATFDLEKKERDVEEYRAALGRAETELEAARRTRAELERKLAELEDPS